MDPARHAFKDRMRTATGFAIASLILTAAGCEDDTARDAITPADTLASIVRSPEDTARQTGPAEGGQEVAATLVEWFVELSRESVPAGRVVFRAVNTGSVEHALEVEGQGIEEETDNLQPGGTATLAVDLAPGTYEVYCPVVTDGVSHREQGMTTTLVVR